MDRPHLEVVRPRTPDLPVGRSVETDDHDPSLERMRCAAQSPGLPATAVGQHDCHAPGGEHRFEHIDSGILVGCGCTGRGRRRRQRGTHCGRLDREARDKAGPEQASHRAAAGARVSKACWGRRHPRLGEAEHDGPAPADEARCLSEKVCIQFVVQVQDQRICLSSEEPSDPRPGRVLGAHPEHPVGNEVGQGGLSGGTGGRACAREPLQPPVHDGSVRPQTRARKTGSPVGGAGACACGPAATQPSRRGCARGRREGRRRGRRGAPTVGSSATRR